MQRTMTTFEYAYLIRNEFEQFIGKHFSKIYQIGKNKLRFKIGDRDIVYDGGIRLNVAKYIEESAEKGKLAQLIVKKLENARLEKITQHNSDRVIIFEFGSSGAKLSLIFEMFGDGNAILVGEGKTVAALHEESWSDREIKHGVEYKFPKSNIKHLAKETISDKYAIVCLLQLPYGKEYIADVLAKLAIEEKKQGSELSSEEIAKIEKTLALLNQDAKPFGFYKNGSIVDFGLAKFSKYDKEDVETREFQSLSEAIEEYYWNNREEKDEKVERLKRRLEEQETRLVELKALEEELKKAGDYVYENFAKVEGLLKAARTMHPDELEEKLKSHGIKVNKVNKKDKEIEIEV